MRSTLILIGCLLFNTLSFGQYKQGYIVDKHNQVFPGLLKYKGTDKVGFKESKDSKSEDLGIKDLKAFTIEEDSFITIDYQDLVSEIRVNCFSKVILKGPTDFLFKEVYREVIEGWSRGEYRRVVTGLIYLVKHNEVIYPITDYNFYVDMPKLISDHDALCKKIRLKEVSFQQIDEIVQEYNIWRRFHYIRK
jgi:hypothetical protein